MVTSFSVFRLPASSSQVGASLLQCPHQGAKNMKEEVTIAKVDCTEQTALCSAQDVTGYPTLKFFKSGAEKEDGVKYRGGRDLDSLQKFINEKLGAEVAEEKPAAAEADKAKVEAGLHILSG